MAKTLTTEEINISLNVLSDKPLKSLKDMRDEMKLLNLAMSDPNIGKAQFDALSQRMGELKNDTQDANKAMKALDPGELLGGFTKMAQGAVGAFGTVTAAMDLFGSENEVIQEIQKKSMAIIQLMMGLESARQLLIDAGARKENAAYLKTFVNQAKKVLGLGAETAATTANTVAQGANAAATNTVTAATWKWNASLLANPVVLITAGVLALVAGIYLLSKAFTANEVDSKAVKEANEKLRDTYKELNDELDTYIAKTKAAELEYKLINGDITEHEAALENLRVQYVANAKTADDAYADRLKEFEDRKKKALEETDSEKEKIKLQKIFNAEKIKLEKTYVDEKAEVDKMYLIETKKAELEDRLEREKKAKEHADALKAIWENYYVNIRNIQVNTFKLTLEAAKKEKNDLIDIQNEIAVNEFQKNVDYYNSVQKTEESITRIISGETLIRMTEARKAFDERRKQLNEGSEAEIQMQKEINEKQSKNTRDIQLLQLRLQKETTTAQRNITLDAIQTLQKDNESLANSIESKYINAGENVSDAYAEMINELGKIDETRAKQIYQQYLTEIGLTEKEFSFKQFTIESLDALQIQYIKDQKTRSEKMLNDMNIAIMSFLYNEKLITEESAANWINSYKSRAEALRLNIEKELENVSLSEAEMFSIRAYYAQQLTEIEIEEAAESTRKRLRSKKLEWEVDKQIALDAVNAREKAQLILWKDNEEKKTEITEKAANDRAEIEREAAKQTRDFMIDQAQAISDASMQILQNQTDHRNEVEESIRNEKYTKETDAVNSLAEAELITTEEKEKRLAEIEKQKAEEERKAKERIWKADKVAALTEVAINTAVAIMKAAPVVPLQIATGIAGALQAAVIQSQQMPIFAQGGLIRGRKHAAGGTLIEAEDGEVIINSRSSQMFRSQLSAINQAGGGVSFPMISNQPAVASNNMTSTIDTSVIETIVSKIASIPVIISESDVTKTQRKVKTYETNSQF